MIAFCYVNARVIGEQPFQPAIDVGRNRRLPALVNGDGADRLQRGFDRAAFDLGRLNVGEPPLGRFDLHRELVEVGSSARSRHQFHAANRASSRTRLANLRMHRAGVDCPAVAAAAGARWSIGSPNPSDALGNPTTTMRAMPAATNNPTGSSLPVIHANRLRIGEAEDVTGVVLDADGSVDITRPFRSPCLRAERVASRHVKASMRTGTAASSRQHDRYPPQVREEDQRARGSQEGHQTRQMQSSD